MPRRALGNVERRTWPTGRVTYRARWHDAAGKSQRASFDTRAEAEAFLAERFVELARGGSASMAGRRTTLAECWETWQAGRQVSLLARRREQSAWACWIEPHLGSVKPCDLRRSSVQAWVAGQARSGLAPRTVERNVAVLRSCLSPAVADGLIAANPAAKASAQRAPKSEERFLSADEVYRLVEAVEPPNYRSMVAFGVACGAEDRGARRPPNRRPRPAAPAGDRPAHGFGRQRTVRPCQVPSRRRQGRADPSDPCGHAHRRAGNTAPSRACLADPERRFLETGELAA
jgi:hypothetical protein